MIVRYRQRSPNIDAVAMAVGFLLDAAEHMKKDPSDVSTEGSLSAPVTLTPLADIMPMPGDGRNPHGRRAGAGHPSRVTLDVEDDAAA